MRKINFSKSLDVSSINALNIVLDFNEYKNFVPGCSGASLIKRNHPIEIGKLEFNILGKEYFITSENTLTDDSITIDQLDGPFDYFKGKWQVKETSIHACKISFEAEFKLPFLLNAITPQSLIDSISSNIIDSFIKQVK